jgi:hypothetical protein
MIRLGKDNKPRGKAMNSIEVFDMANAGVFECNAEAIICGETYDVYIVKDGEYDTDLCIVDVLFENGFVERLAVVRGNVFPKDMEAKHILRRKLAN